MTHYYFVIQELPLDSPVAKLQAALKHSDIYIEGPGVWRFGRALTSEFVLTQIRAFVKGRHRIKDLPVWTASGRGRSVILKHIQNFLHSSTSGGPAKMSGVRVSLELPWIEHTISIDAHFVNPWGEPLIPAEEARKVREAFGEG